MTWTVGQVPTASDLNTTIRDNLLAVLGPVAGPSRLSPAGSMVYESPGSYPFGDNVDYAACGYHLLHWDLLNAIGLPQWRMRAVFLPTLIVPGAPSLVSWTGGWRLEAGAGEVLGVGGIGTAYSAVVAVPNTGAFCTPDSGWADVSASGMRLYSLVHHTARVGGSGNGTIGELALFSEVRNVL